MNTNPSAQLFEQIAQIKRMERGKLTVMRQTPDVRGGGNMAQYGRFENGPGHSGLRASRRGPTDLSAGPWEAVRC
ncbi:MAG: hypothetical protein KA191_17545, partial [Verrucomicrobia bacterium]|nr:hypothetical protein [Verrucomicrobiota bacterium]